MILHIELCRFFTACIENRIPDLRGRPFVVVSHINGDRVWALSPAASRLEIYRSMPVREAQRRARTLAVLPADMQHYHAVHQQLTEVVSGYSPIIEDGRFGQFYLDLLQQPQQAHNTASRLLQEVHERLALPAAIGLGSNKLVSRAAAQKAAGQHGIVQVLPGNEADFLTPFRLRILPHVDRRIAEALRALNIFRVGELRNMPENHLQELFGKTGKWLFLEARGQDFRPLVMAQAQQHLQEGWHFASATNDFGKLSAACNTLLNRLARQLRKRGVGAHHLTLTAIYGDGKYFSRSRTVHGYSDAEERLAPALQAVLESAVARRLAIKYLGISLSKFVTTRQGELFEQVASSKRRQLTTALDRLQDRYGERAVSWGRQLG
ncbi:MAG: hypothetical protein H6695_10385 [Deferribacteres bacterium]|nr:hypothetical protein [candidate division KSB1 bacterium]MCB9510581.1 hypothetical protein [Deferribacteres bacterium]